MTTLTETDPALALLAAPESVTVRFRYGDRDLVAIAETPGAMAHIGRMLRITRARRHGTAGHRTWTIAVRRPEQRPRPSVPRKRR